MSIVFEFVYVVPSIQHSHPKDSSDPFSIFIGNNETKKRPSQPIGVNFAKLFAAVAILFPWRMK